MKWDGTSECVVVILAKLRMPVGAVAIALTLPITVASIVQDNTHIGTLP